MRISGEIYHMPEGELSDVIASQKTVRTTKLLKLVEPLLHKVAWQEETLGRNVKTIRALNDRAQRAEHLLEQSKNDIIDMRLERQDLRLELADLELAMRRIGYR